MSDQTKPSKGNGGDNGHIEFQYIKANNFGVVHADGVWGGITPRGYISMSFFSERHPIPQKLVHEIEDGRIGKERSRETRAGIIREVNAEVLVDLTMAKSFRDWLDEKINHLEKRVEPVKDKK